MSLLERWGGLVEGNAISGSEFRSGIRLADHGAVADLEVVPGLIEGDVDHRGIQRATLGVRTLPTRHWETVAAAIAEHPEWSTQLNAHRVPTVLVDQLLPNELSFTASCGCGSSGGWCRHVVAIAAAFGTALERDPLGGLTVLGADRRQLLGERGDSRSMPYGLEVPTSATAAYRRKLGELPRVPTVAAEARFPSALSVAPPPGSGVSNPDVLALIADASSRAHQFLTGASDDLYVSTPIGLDVIRLAATGDVAHVSAITGLDRTELEAAATSWNAGGAEAVRVLRDQWEPDPAQLLPGAEALGQNATTRNNTVTAHGMQLRLDRRDRWWLLTHSDAAGWIVVAGPSLAPGELLADVDAAAGPDSEK